MARQKERKNKDMKKLDDKFVVELIAEGSFVDNKTENGSTYLVEVFTIRLNYLALNAWILSETFNCRECYDTDKEWEDHKAEYKAKREAWNKQIMEALKINSEVGSISITQSLSEVFTVVHIEEIKPMNLTTV